MGSHILILGATGKTGRLTLGRLVDLGRDVTIGGRNVMGLSTLSREHDVPYIQLDIADKARLISAFRDFDVIINLIGPFSALGYIPVEAAISAGTHYLDCSWEQDHIARLGAYRESAELSKIAVVPGLGVSPGLSDLLAAVGQAEFDECRAISVLYVEGMRNRFSAGTLLSAARAMKSASFRFESGRLVPMTAGDATREHVFDSRFGHQLLFSYPSADSITIPAYIGTQSVACYFGAEAATRFFLLLRVVPFSADSIFMKALCKGLSWLCLFSIFGHHGFAVDVEIEGLSRGTLCSRRYSLTSEADPYLATATLLASGAVQMIDEKHEAAGVVSPGHYFDSEKFLNDAGFTVARQDSR